jgi:hypothetical protein
MLHTKTKGSVEAGATDSSFSGDKLAARVEQIPTKRALKKLAVFQNTMLGLIIGISCIIVVYLVLHYLPDAVRHRRPDAPAASGSDSSSMDPGMYGTAIPTDAGKEVHVALGASGDIVRWRFQVEDEDDCIKAFYMRGDGAVYIISKSEKYGARLDVVSAKGKIIGASKAHLKHTLRAVGTDGALYCHEQIYEHQQLQFDGLCAFNLQGRQLWRAPMPRPFSNNITVGADGTVYATGCQTQTKLDAHAHSCLCAFSAAGKLKWTYEQESQLYWPQPLADGRVLVWSRPRFDRYYGLIVGDDRLSNAELKQLPDALLCLGRDGGCEWSYTVGQVEAGYASAANGRICTAAVEAGTQKNQQLVLLSLSAGRELARYPSGPLSGPPLLLPDGSVIFQNEANVLVKLSPGMKVLWTKELLNPLRSAPLADGNGVLYMHEGCALVCLTADGSERFRIPTASSLIGQDAVWGPDGMIYVPTSREVLAFKPE